MQATDDFNRADGEVGANWTGIPDWFPVFVVSNEASPSPTDNSAARFSSQTPPDDQKASVLVGSIIETQANKGAGPICRAVVGEQKFYFAVVNSAAAGEYEYGRVNEGVVTMLGAVTSLGTPSTGQRLELRCIGTTISMNVDDVEVASTTDATFAAGQCGLVHMPWNQNPTLDDWQGGSLTEEEQEQVTTWLAPIE